MRMDAENVTPVDFLFVSDFVIARTPMSIGGRGNLVKDYNYYIYILSNVTRTVLYTGVTNNLVKRVWEHKHDLVKGFTNKYHVHDLVYYESFDNIQSAIEREKQIKSWSRKRKDELIVGVNPSKKDLYSELI